MTTIVSLDEFAYAIRLSAGQAAAHQMLLELAEGLVKDELGELDQYPTKAKVVALGAAARAYFNIQGHQQEELSGSVRQPLDLARFVFLSADDLGQLHGSDGRTPTYEFPGTWPYPDPVERPADSVSG